MHWSNLEVIADVVYSLNHVRLFCDPIDYRLSEKEMATHSSIFAWRILWTEEPGALLSMGSHRVRHNWSNLSCMHALEKEMATHSSILAWRIPGTEEPGGLPSMGSHRVGHDWSNLAVAAADCRLQGPSVHGIFQQDYQNGLPFPSLGDLPNPGIEPTSLYLLHCRWILYHWASGEAHRNN